jgi:hypothetical protein
MEEVSVDSPGIDLEKAQIIDSIIEAGYQKIPSLDIQNGLINVDAKNHGENVEISN